MSQNHLLMGLLAIFTFGCASQKPQISVVSNSASSVVSDVPCSTSLPPDRIDSNHNHGVPISINRKPGFDANIFHYSDQGSGFIPLRLLGALVDSKTKKPYLNNLERYGLVSGEKSERWNPDGLPVGIAINTLTSSVEDVRMFGFTCAACHTSDIRYNGKIVRIEGGSGLFYVDALGDDIQASLGKTFADVGESFAFLKRFTIGMDEQEHGPYGGPETVINQAENPGHQGLDLGYRYRFLKQARSWLAKPGNRLPGGYGRADDFGTARVELFGDFDKDHGTLQERNLEKANAPVSIPSLWNTNRYLWLHWNGNTNSAVQRNIGQSLGVGATFNTAGSDKYGTSVNIVNQMKAEQQIAHIAVPEWPEEMLGKIDPIKRDYGSRIYKEKCAGCHDSFTRNEKGLLTFRMFTLDEIGTDPAYAVNFSKQIHQNNGTKIDFADAIALLLEKLQVIAKDGMSKEDRQVMKTLERGLVPTWRDTLTQNDRKVYPAKPLDGIWATAPYLHNGSVPTLYHLLLPAKDRPSTFVVGPQDFLPDQVGFEWDSRDFCDMRDKHNRDKELFLLDTRLPGNRNTGHEYGVDLTEKERWALVEYLKVHKTPSLSRIGTRSYREKTSKLPLAK